MDPQEIFAGALEPGYKKPGLEQSKPEMPATCPGLQPRPHPAPVSGTDSSKLDPIAAALDRLATIEGCLFIHLGRGWLAYLDGHWRVYETQGDPQPFRGAVDRLWAFTRAIGRAGWMLATLEANRDPVLPEIAAGLQEGGLVDREVRRRWEAAVEEAWAFYIANLGVLKSEIPPELA